jgi:hypothetical protein
LCFDGLFPALQVPDQMTVEVDHFHAINRHTCILS